VGFERGARRNLSTVFDLGRPSHLTQVPPCRTWGPPIPDSARSAECRGLSRAVPCSGPGERIGDNPQTQVVRLVRLAVTTPRLALCSPPYKARGSFRTLTASARRAFWRLRAGVGWLEGSSQGMLAPFEGLDSSVPSGHPWVLSKGLTTTAVTLAPLSAPSPKLKFVECAPIPSAPETGGVTGEG
jgi:hypothetical protein